MTNIIQTSVELWQSKKISSSQLLRDLFGYDKWIVPISEKAMAEALGNNTMPAISYSRNEQGEDSLFIFSDIEVFDAYGKKVGNIDSYYLEVQGSWIFSFPFKGFTYCNINADTPSAIYYGREHFKMLNDTAKAVLIERKLKSFRYVEISGAALDACLSEIKNYSNFYLIIEYSGEKVEPVIAPDDKERHLLAAFTAQDNANVFYDPLERNFSGRDFRLAPTGGSLVAQALLKFNFEGIVFNCIGYSKSVAFTPQFANFIINAQ